MSREASDRHHGGKYEACFVFSPARMRCGRGDSNSSEARYTQVHGDTPAPIQSRRNGTQPSPPIAPGYARIRGRQHHAKHHEPVRRAAACPNTRRPSATDPWRSITMESIINHAQPGGCYDAHGSQCPTWCIVTRDPELPHVGKYSTVPLSLSGQPGQLLFARLEKGYSSPGTYVAIVHEDRYDLDLTVAEAAELAGLLAALVAKAVTQDPADGAR